MNGVPCRKHDGHFIPQWVNYLNKQTLIPHILIVLGNNHGADLQYLDQQGIQYTYCDSQNMGKLRNAALNLITTKWQLYFSVDDELLPHACESIVNSKCDAVSLMFDVININGTVETNCKSPVINDQYTLQRWKQFRWGGYTAFQDKHIRYNEAVEIPNILLHVELFKKRLKTELSNSVCAICHRWAQSPCLPPLEAPCFSYGEESGGTLQE